MVFCPQEEDEQEHFEHLRYELLADSPSAISFYNAQNRTVQRVSLAHTNTVIVGNEWVILSLVHTQTNIAVWLSHTRSLLVTPRTKRLLPKWHPYCLHSFCLEPYGPWSKAVHYKGTMVLFGKHPESKWMCSGLSVQRNYSKAMSQTPVQKTTPRGSGRTKLPAILSVIWRTAWFYPFHQ